MKTLKIISTISFIFIIISCSDIKQNYYKNLYNLTDNQEMWLPEILYNNDIIKEYISEIFENHDLDTNEIWGTFQSDIDIFKIIEVQNSEDFSFNKEKLRKRLKLLNYQNDLKSGIFYNTKKFNCIFYFNLEKKLYYYYGVYK